MIFKRLNKILFSYSIKSNSNHSINGLFFWEFNANVVYRLYLFISDEHTDNQKLNFKAIGRFFLKNVFPDQIQIYGFYS